jgi:hypothetical protein
VSRETMSARVTTLMMFATAILTSCTSLAAPDVSGPYAARLARVDIQQIAALPFASNGIHSIYANKPDKVGVQIAQPQCVQCACHDTLPWLISFSLGLTTKAQALFAIEDEDVRQTLVQDVHRHSQGLEVGRNDDFTSSHNPAFEFLG